MTIQALREKRAQVVADMEAILDTADTEARDLTAEEQEIYDAYADDLNQVKAKIERRESLDAEKDALVAIDTPAVSRSQGAGSRVVAPEAKREFSSLGEFMGAVVKHARGKGTDPRLDYHDDAAIQAAGPDGQNMGDGAAGGFMVPTQWRDTLMRVEPQEAIIRGRSNVIPAGTPPDAEITMPALDQTGDAPNNVFGGVEMNWIGEAQTKPKTEAKFREISLRPHELAGHIPITDKLMRNAPAMSGMVEQMMRQALISAQEFAFMSGDGVSKPTGILNSNATISVNRDTANTVVYDDVVNLLEKMLMEGGTPYWLASQSIYGELARLQSPEGHLIWQQNAVDGSPGSLMGYPVFWHQRSPLKGTRGDLTIVNSNPYYLVKDGSGPFVDAGFIGDDFVNNQTRIKVFTNVDAKCWLTEPFKQEGDFEVSPFVTLDVPNG